MPWTPCLCHRHPVCAIVTSSRAFSNGSRTADLMSAALADIWPARFCCSAASVGAGAGDTGSVVVPTPVQGVQVGGLVVVVVSEWKVGFRVKGYPMQCPELEGGQGWIPTAVALWLESLAPLQIPHLCRTRLCQWTYFHEFTCSGRARRDGRRRVHIVLLQRGRLCR